MPVSTGEYCPLLKRGCVKDRCAWYTHLRGTDPQTGSEIDKGGCAISFLPIVTLETNKEVRQAASATESMRNENISAANNICGVMSHGIFLAEEARKKTLIKPQRRLK